VYRVARLLTPVRPEMRQQGLQRAGSGRRTKV
jgi:hypothetical protein